MLIRSLYFLIRAFFQTTIRGKFSEILINSIVDANRMLFLVRRPCGCGISTKIFIVKGSLEVRHEELNSL